MPGKHSIMPRGLEAAGLAPGLRGAKFGRLFPELAAGRYGATRAQESANLEALAQAMVSSFDAPKDGPDDEESGIPALYTYLGQFIDHDLTFDPNGTFAKQKDPNADLDFRTPAFDMDNVYGRGPGDQPYLYEDDGRTLRLGDPLTLGQPPGAHDLQRNGAGRALIGDPRNDENAIVSQLQGLMIHFHNAMAAKHRHERLDHVQTLVRRHYQYMVVNDFLPRIVNRTVLEDLKTGGLYDKAKIKFFNNFAAPLNLPYMPLEFSVAAYRIGHSMIRPGYRLNDATLLPIFPLPASQPGFPEGLTGFRRLVSDWALDWGRFIDIDTRAYGTKDAAATPENFKRLQFAYRIDTALVDPLGSLPASVADNPPPSLALRNLLRGLEFGMPTGQAVATRMGVTVLRDDQILIGQGVDAPDAPLPDITTIAGGAFSGNCPLWTYVLAEAMQNPAAPTPDAPVSGSVSVTTPQLGPVGGRIVAEVFLGLLFADTQSYLNVEAGWTPPAGADFRLKHLVEAALAG